MGPCGFVSCQQRVYRQCRVDVGSHIIGCGCNGQGLAALMVAVVVPLELVCICHQYVWQAMVGVGAAVVFSGRLSFLEGSKVLHLILVKTLMSMFWMPMARTAPPMLQSTIAARGDVEDGGLDQGAVLIFAGAGGVGW